MQVTTRGLRKRGPMRPQSNPNKATPKPNIACTKPLQSHYTATTDPHTATSREQRSTPRPLFPRISKIKHRKCAARFKRSQREASENAPRVAKVHNEMPPKMRREFQKFTTRCLRKMLASFSGEPRDGRVGGRESLRRRPHPPAEFPPPLP